MGSEAEPKGKPDLRRSEYHFTARARLMLLLGEQLITDEVAAVSELVKNAYDADATKVDLVIKNAANPDGGTIQVSDNGNGMDFDTLVKGWLEVATIGKSRLPTEKARRSPILKRPILGEKGLGRLSVHKLGLSTEIVTRSRDSATEAVLKLDWTQFENPDRFLGEIPVNVTERTPTTYAGIDEHGEQAHGTSITISKLKRKWTIAMLRRLYLESQVISSPLAGIRDFVVKPDFDDLAINPTELVSYTDIVGNAIYTFKGTISGSGILEYQYRFNHPNHPEFRREETETTDILDPENFPGGRKPTCGPLRISIYSWELTLEDKRLVFGDAKFFREVIEPNTGVKVYRDGFRVLPYGDEDNDWLGLDQRRTRRFALHVSRNQVIGFVDITTDDNPNLIDKSDREGLLDNDEYRDFYNVVLDAFKIFENLRLEDRERVKEKEGRTQAARKERFALNMNRIQSMLNGPAFSNVPAENKLQLQEMMTETRAEFETLLEETEQPLLVAAGIGLSILLPTHEMRREILEAIKLLKTSRNQDPESLAAEGIEPVIGILQHVDAVIGGIAKLQQKSGYDERFPIERTIEYAELLYKNRLQRRNIAYSRELRIQFEAHGSSRQLGLVILNMLDNSAYWLDKKPPGQRNIKIITDYVDGHPAVIVSDDGPGIQDDIDKITLPFVTRKPQGLGLGLFISRRIAENHDAKLVLLNQDDIQGLLSGANIAIVFLENAPVITGDRPLAK